MDQKFLSPEPVVTLQKYFPSSYQNVIATARTCYSSKGIIADESIDDGWDWLAESLYQAGHHTTFQHGHFQFTLDRVSRHFVWSFLHSHPFYNSEQVSQRYVAVKPGMVTIPPLSGKALDIYQTTIQFQMDRYQSLCRRLYPLVEQEYQKRFRSRDLSQKKYSNEIKKKAQEVARYVLPVATFTYLYHTLSGLTLLRYYRVCEQHDLPFEQRFVVKKMVDALLAVEPKYRVILQEPIPLDSFPETEWLSSHHSDRAGVAGTFIDAFDRSLGTRSSMLISYKTNSEAMLADSVREVLGLPAISLSDEDAVALALSPEKNRLLGESLNLTTVSKLSRCLSHPSYTFRKKISHAADSQDQRHRMTPASRPILAGHLTDRPNYITPELVKQDDQVLAEYQETMQRTWDAMNELRSLGVQEECVQYLLPNAVSIRFTESGDLLNLRHKYAMRLCYNAQEEIWRSSVDEVRQISEIHPTIGKFLLPPCTARLLAKSRPVCPEGVRYCGEKVWSYSMDDFERII